MPHFPLASLPSMIEAKLPEYMANDAQFQKLVADEAKQEQRVKDAWEEARYKVKIAQIEKAAIGRKKQSRILTLKKIIRVDLEREAKNGLPSRHKRAKSTSELISNSKNTQQAGIPDDDGTTKETGA